MPSSNNDGSKNNKETSKHNSSNNNSLQPPTPQILIHNSLAQNLQQLQSPFGTAIASRSRRRSDSRLSRTQSGERSQSMSQSKDMVLVDSKERLSEMATNIRGISNALSNVALTPKVQNVFIITKINDEDLLPKTRELVEWLLNWVPEDDDEEILSDEASVDKLSTDERVETLTHEKAVSDGVIEDDDSVMKSCCKGDLIVHVEDIIANDPQFDLEGLKRDNPDFADNIKLWSPDTVASMSDKLDLAITLGGDGTVLYTSWLFQKIAPPTLSFALGSLGFMTENQYEDYSDILDDHLLHGIRCSLRMRFECCVLRSRNRDKHGSDDLAKEIKEAGEKKRFTTHYKDCDYTILNEVVADRGPNPFVTMTELYGDYELLTCIKADGVVISTPTGSTAYSMSAGGSLVHPEVPAQLISPICPHTLSFRPLVVPDSMELHLGVPYDSRSSAFVSFDGKTRVELHRGDILAIHVSRYPFPKVLPPGNTSVSWVQQLSRTLHWNEQKRPKTSNK